MYSVEEAKILFKSAVSDYVKKHNKLVERYKNNKIDETEYDLCSNQEYSNMHKILSDIINNVSWYDQILLCKSLHSNYIRDKLDEVQLTTLIMIK